MFKVATWNVNSLRVRLSQVLEWLQSSQPDVLALQETKLIDSDFPLEPFREAGYEAVFCGQKTFNGVAVLSRIRSTDRTTNFPCFEDEQRRVLGVTVGGIRILNLYVPNGESVVSPKFSYKLEWLQHLQAFLREELQKYPQMIVLGDFNIAPEEQDVHDPAQWAGQVLFSERERMAFREMLQLNFVDCFRLQTQPAGSFTWWDYRLNAFKRNRGLRIDHILASSALSPLCQRCYIDVGPRAHHRPSDHTPVVAEFDL